MAKAALKFATRFPASIAGVRPTKTIENFTRNVQKVKHQKIKEYYK